MQTVDGGLRANGGLRVFVTWKEPTQRNIPGRKVLHEISKKNYLQAVVPIESGCVTDLCLPEFTSPPAPSSLLTHHFVILSE